MGKGHAHTHELLEWDNNDSSFTVELLRQSKLTLPAPVAERLPVGMVHCRALVYPDCCRDWGMLEGGNRAN